MTEKRRLSLFIFNILIICCSLTGHAIKDFSIDERSFVCETQIDNINKSLNLGTQSFLLNLKEVESKYIVTNSVENHYSLNQVSTQINQYLKTNQSVIIPLILFGDIDKSNIIQKLSRAFSNKLFVTDAQTKWPKLDSLVEQRIHVVAIFADDIASTSIDKIDEDKRYSKRFSSDPLNKMILFSSNAATDSSLEKECFNAWNKTGKVPNFIAAPRLKQVNVRMVSNRLNHTRRFQGVVSYKDKLLNEVFWNHSTDVITPAKFSFPILETTHIFSPYKNGYRISPSEVIHNTSMKDALRIFTAYDTSPEDKLVQYFPFENQAENQIEPDWSGSIIKDVSFIHDEERGNVLHLSKTNSFIDYSKENSLNFNSPISISVWIKPDSLPKFMGIMGIGTSFSLKLRNGSPDFTTATIKDHAIKRVLEVDKWYHIAAVFKPNYTVLFYINGEKEGEIFTYEINPSNHSLVIGNNVWGEQFYGSIDDLKIWNRGLSEEEIAKLHQLQPENSPPFYWISSILTLALIFVFYFIRKNKKTLFKRKEASIVTANTEVSKISDSSKTPDNSNVLPKATTPKKEKIPQDRLSLFGTFSMISKEREDISTRFSPLLKQILSFIILESEKDRNGISINKLTDTFWPGSPIDKAKENRRANIKKLRKALSNIDGLQIVYRDKKWHVETEPEMFVDIIEYNKLRTTIEAQISNHEIDIQLLHELLDLLKHGNILQNLEVEWLDDFKNTISEEVIDLLSRIYDTQKLKCSVDDKIKLAKTMLVFDHLNENVLTILIIELVSAGKHGQAKNEYESFTKNYKVLYGESFHVKYQNIVANTK